VYSAILPDRFFAGIIIGLTDPYSLYDEGAINFYAIISVFAGLIVAYVIMVLIGNNKTAKRKAVQDENLLDDQV
jgi:phage shock protein PspC (stress-responsive transcriptional regulator)